MSTSSGRVDQPTWERLLEAFRQDPSNIAAAARHAGVQRRTAARAYRVGYPDRPWGVKSIQALLMEESTLARARLQLEDESQELQEDRDALQADKFAEEARQRSITTREEEGRMVRATRVLTLNSLGAAMKTASGLALAMERLGGAFAAIAAKTEDLSSKDVSMLSTAMRRYSSTLRELSQAGQTAMEMERLFLGEPTQMIGITGDLDRTPIEELVKLAGYQDGVLRRAQERGLVLLDGGLSAAKKTE